MQGRGKRVLGLSLLVSLTALLASARPDNEATEESPPKKIEAVLNVPGHTQAITQTVISPDDKRLYTVSAPGEVREWDVSSGEHLRVWHFPVKVSCLAMAPKGKYLAVAGAARPAGKKVRESPIWFIHPSTGEVEFKTALLNGDGIHALAFHPKGTRLAVNVGKRLAMVNVKTGEEEKLKTGKEEKLKTGPVGVLKVGVLNSLEFDPSGRWLITARATSPDKGETVRAYNVGPKSDGKPVQLSSGGRAGTQAAWSKNGKQVVSISGGTDVEPSMQIWKFDGNSHNPDRVLNGKFWHEALKEKIKPWITWFPIGVFYRSDSEVIAAWEVERDVKLFSVALKIDPKTREVTGARATILSNPIHHISHFPGLAFTSDRRYLVTPAVTGYNLAMYDLKEKKQVTSLGEDLEEVNFRLGPPLAVPRAVAWMPTGYAPVWSHFIAAKRPKDWQTKVAYGRDLLKLGYVPKEERINARGCDLPMNWTFEYGDKRSCTLVKPKKSVLLELTNVSNRSPQLTPGKGGQLVVIHDNGQRIAVVNPTTGKTEKHVGTKFAHVYSMALSPDGKYLLVAGGKTYLEIFDMANPARPILNLLGRSSDWVVWTPEGYYFATPGAENMLGWKVNSGNNELARIYPAQVFRKQLRRPDVIQNVLTTGSTAKALARIASQTAAKTPENTKEKTPSKTPVVNRSVDIEDYLPPVVTILSAEKASDDKTSATLQVRVDASGKQYPEHLRLYVNGRLLHAEKPRKLDPKKSSQTVTWQVRGLPPGTKELKILADADAVSGLSPPYPYSVPLPDNQKPGLHVISVGLNYTSDKALELRYAVNDADGIEKVFTSKSCVGGDHVYRKGSSRPLLGAQATRANILKALRDVQKDVKAGDLLVFFFAGHGIARNQKFYLLTNGAMMDEKNNIVKLEDHSITGEELRKELNSITCQVLVVLDACHSGKAAAALRNYRPDTDDLEKFAEDECGAFLFAAAGIKEYAEEPPVGGKHGRFTQAMIDVLRDGTRPAFNRFDGLQYLRHLSMEVKDAVQNATNDRQHPCISEPGTYPEFPIRRIR